jgi:hypothetical protein
MGNCNFHFSRVFLGAKCEFAKDCQAPEEGCDTCCKGLTKSLGSKTSGMRVPLQAPVAQRDLRRR